MITKRINIEVEERTIKTLGRLQAKQELETGERPTQSQVVSEALEVYAGMHAKAEVERKPEEVPKKEREIVEKALVKQIGELSKMVHGEEKERAEEEKPKVKEEISPFFRANDLKNAGVKP